MKKKNSYTKPDPAAQTAKAYQAAAASEGKGKSEQKRKKGWWIRPLIITAIVAAVLFGAFLAYAGEYYRADDAQVQAMLESHQTQPVENTARIAFQPETPTEIGLIFYPGALVDERAYEPLMQQVADQGIACYIIRMPYHLAIFDMYGADKVMKAHPEIKEWYLAGHSLGGVAASTYAARFPGKVKGIALIASYSTKNLKKLEDFKVLSIYGSEDSVLNSQQYQKRKINLPDTMTEVLIPGGNHAGFACYGPQSGDGTASISTEEQIALAAEKIAAMILDLPVDLDQSQDAAA